jgi:hypothetical protein
VDQFLLQDQESYACPIYACRGPVLVKTRYFGSASICQVFPTTLNIQNLGIVHMIASGSSLEKSILGR